MSSYAKFVEKMKSIGAGLNYVMRGMQGLPPEEDVFSGLIDVKDEIERSRMPSLHEVYAQEFMRLLAEYGGDEWGIYGKIASLDAKLFIPLEGEQRKEAILMRQASRQPAQPALTVALPQVETKASQPEGKKRFWKRGEPKQ